MLDECSMTDDCPGYDRDRRMCLLRPDDCEFSPADGDTPRRHPGNPVRDPIQQEMDI